jgi:hypothetical protein
MAASQADRLENLGSVAFIMSPPETEEKGE